jgi:hypothetical protein
MRSIILLAMFTVNLAAAAGEDYEEQRDLSLSATGIGTVDIEAGAGSLEVSGVSGADEIIVTATIQIPDRDTDNARKIIESDLVLTLEKREETAVLKAWFDNRFWRRGDTPSVHLLVHMPDNLNLAVDDGSGSITVSDITGAIRVEDGSGSITMTSVGGEVQIDDGSGSITVDDVGGDLSIDDGSGGIKIRGVAGSVIIDDGSGSINVSDVEQDLIIVDDGSGGLNISNIKGRVDKDS